MIRWWHVLQPQPWGVSPLAPVSCDFHATISDLLRSRCPPLPRGTRSRVFFGKVVPCASLLRLCLTLVLLVSVPKAQSDLPSPYARHDSSGVEPVSGRARLLWYSAVLNVCCCDEAILLLRSLCTLPCCAAFSSSPSLWLPDSWSLSRCTFAASRCRPRPSCSRP